MDEDWKNNYGIDLPMVDEETMKKKTKKQIAAIRRRTNEATCTWHEWQTERPLDRPMKKQKVIRAVKPCCTGRTKPCHTPEYDPRTVLRLRWYFQWLPRGDKIRFMNDHVRVKPESGDKPEKAGGLTGNARRYTYRMEKPELLEQRIQDRREGRAVASRAPDEDYLPVCSSSMMYLLGVTSKRALQELVEKTGVAPDAGQHDKDDGRPRPSAKTASAVAWMEKCKETYLVHPNKPYTVLPFLSILQMHSCYIEEMEEAHKVDWAAASRKVYNWNNEVVLVGELAQGDEEEEDTRTQAEIHHAAHHAEMASLREAPEDEEAYQNALEGVIENWSCLTQRGGRGEQKHDMDDECIEEEEDLTADGDGVVADVDEAAEVPGAREEEYDGQQLLYHAARGNGRTGTGTNSWGSWESTPKHPDWHIFPSFTKLG